MKESHIAGARIARILLVEDNPDDAEIARRAFERARIGNPLSVVADGQDALDLLYRNCSEQGEPGVEMMLLDLGLPRLDGRAVMREVWADKRLRHIPVIILTGSERENDLIEAYRGGAVAFLHKPVNVERLLTAIGDLPGYQLFITRFSEKA